MFLLVSVDDCYFLIELVNPGVIKFLLFGLSIARQSLLKIVMALLIFNFMIWLRELDWIGIYVNPIDGSLFGLGYHASVINHSMINLSILFSGLHCVRVDESVYVHLQVVNRFPDHVFAFEKAGCRLRNGVEDHLVFHGLSYFEMEFEIFIELLDVGCFLVLELLNDFVDGLVVVHEFDGSDQSYALESVGVVAASEDAAIHELVVGETEPDP